MEEKAVILDSHFSVSLIHIHVKPAAQAKYISIAGSNEKELHCSEKNRNLKYK